MIKTEFDMLIEIRDLLGNVFEARQTEGFNNESVKVENYEYSETHNSVFFSLEYPKISFQYEIKLIEVSPAWPFSKNSYIIKADIRTIVNGFNNTAGIYLEPKDKKDREVSRQIAEIFDLIREQEISWRTYDIIEGSNAICKRLRALKNNGTTGKSDTNFGNKETTGSHDGESGAW